MDNFKAYNDFYGFSRDDQVIEFSAQIIKNAAKKCGSKDCFIGHIGGDDFVIVEKTEAVAKLSSEIIASFDKGIREFYNSEDLSKNCISSLDRKGQKQDFPIMSISMAGVDLGQNSYEHNLSVVESCSEVKKRAKDISGSVFVRERRHR